MSDQSAEQAWQAYRDKAMREEFFNGANALHPTSFRRVGRRLRKREFMAGFKAGRAAASTE